MRLAGSQRDDAGFWSPRSGVDGPAWRYRRRAAAERIPWRPPGAPPAPPLPPSAARRKTHKSAARAIGSGNTFALSVAGQAFVAAIQGLDHGLRRAAVRLGDEATRNAILPDFARTWCDDRAARHCRARRRSRRRKPAPADRNVPPAASPRRTREMDTPIPAACSSSPPRPSSFPALPPFDLRLARSPPAPARARAASARASAVRTGPAVAHR